METDMDTCTECLDASVVLRVSADSPGEPVYVPCPECQPAEEPAPQVAEVLAGRHIAERKPDSAYVETYAPRHCAGNGRMACLHNHAGHSSILRGVMHFLAPWTSRRAA